MEKVAYYNGVFSSLDEAKMPVTDRACYFGDGIYEALYARNGIPFALEDHFARLYRSAEKLRIEAPAKEELTEIIMKALSMTDAKEAFVYFQISRGNAMRQHEFPFTPVPASVMLYTQPHELFDLTKPMRLITREDTRWLHCDIKSLNLIPSVLAAEDAYEAKADEAIFIRDGKVTECSASNLLILKDGEIVTAPNCNLLLPGITKKHIIELAGTLGIPVTERFMTLEEVMAADEVIITNCVTLGANAYEIEGTPVGGKDPERLAAIRAAYYAKVEAECGAL